MAHYGTLQDYRFQDTDADDIRGCKVYGVNDEKLGKIDDVVFDHTTGQIHYLVIDTGGWLLSHKFLVPADRLQSSAEHPDDYQVNLTKDQIETFPPYDERDLRDDRTWGDYENRYRSKWETGPVMHRAETDRNVTPTTSQMTRGTGATGPKNWETGARSTSGVSTPTGVGSSGANDPGLEGDTAELDIVEADTLDVETTYIDDTGAMSSERRGADIAADMGSTDRVIPATADEVEIKNSASGIGSRWSNFEERLRQRRHEITSGCASCGPRPTSETASERGRRAS
jgi:sporulation protein YlmC with PRC-barrel domain